MRLSFQAEDNCHFEPIPHLSFRAEGEKSWVSIPIRSEGEGWGCRDCRLHGSRGN